MLRVLLPLLGFAVIVYALIDCIQTAENRVQHLPKMAWLAVIMLVPLLGAVAWLIVGRQRSVPFGRRGGPPPRPRGPDDDPDFLRGL